ncbi:hypothetical protein DL89DRAFT_293202 [Linderina pennispora]|uniref:Uncharacterized protein n=1 Tax=Linderina pennispora TaxID=61395 RepID=A0A1Y1W802_9FUNG|nr:uncharacterized protein DL89DRAFT_293202 [Linderina pennispora]ORX69572.1 hypothetical protein DL89DRAFT_293202 [Linderina pennispora]
MLARTIWPARTTSTCLRRYHAERHSSLQPLAWVISDANPLRELRATALATALGLPYTIKRPKPARLPPLMQRQMLSLQSLVSPTRTAFSHISDTNTQADGLPRVVIGSSPDSLMGVLETKERSQGRSFSVFYGLPDTKINSIDALLLSRLDQMKLRAKGPARDQLDNALFTMLPFSGSPKTPAVVSNEPNIVVCLGPGVEPSGFHMLVDDVDRLFDALAHLPTQNITMVLSKQLHKSLRRKLTAQMPQHIRTVDLATSSVSPADILVNASQVVVSADDLDSLSLAISLHKPVYVFGEERTEGLLRNYYRLLDTNNLVRRFYPRGSRSTSGSGPDHCIYSE